MTSQTNRRRRSGRRSGVAAVAVAVAFLAAAAEPARAQSVADGAFVTRVRLGAAMTGAPARTADGSLIVATLRTSAFLPAALYRLPASGTLQLLATLPDDVDATPAIGPDGTIYVGCWNGRLYAFTPSGSQKWAYDTGAFIYSSAAVGIDGTVYVGSGDAQVHAVNPDGTRKWAYAVGDWVDASPVVGGDGTVYVGSWDGTFYALRPDGAVRWSVAVGAAITGSAALLSDGAVVVGDREGALHCFRSDGKPRWVFETGDAIDGSPVVGPDDTVYFGSGDGYFHAVRADGTLAWKRDLGTPLVSTPLLRADGSVVFGGGDFRVHCLNADGTPRWSYLTGDYVDGAPVIRGTDRVVVGSQDGWLYQLQSGAVEGGGAWPQARGDRTRRGRAAGPVILSAPAPVVADPGGNATFTVAASGAGVVTYQWQFNGTNVAGATGPSLSVSPVVAAKQGDYRVVVTDETGKQVSAPAKLTVTGAASALVNLSTRGRAGSGERTLIPGFVATGTGTSPVLVRAVGPTLAVPPFGLGGTIPDPFLRLYRGGAEVAANDQWWTVPEVAVVAAAVGAFPLTEGSLDAAWTGLLGPGATTALAADAAGVDGLELVEVYDAASPPGGGTVRLVNLSTRGWVGAGNDLLIAGLVVSGNAPQLVLVRALGPALVPFGITEPLVDPQMTVFSGSTVLASSVDWSSSPQEADLRKAAEDVGAPPLAEGSRDDALMLSLMPGVYTVHVTGAGGATGVALIEVFAVPGL